MANGMPNINSVKIMRNLFQITYKNAIYFKQWNDFCFQQYDDLSNLKIHLIPNSQMWESKTSAGTRNSKNRNTQIWQKLNACGKSQPFPHHSVLKTVHAENSNDGG